MGPEMIGEVLHPAGESGLLDYFRPFVSSAPFVQVPVDNAAPWTSSGASAAKTSEGGAITASLADLGQIQVVMHRIAALTHVSDEALEDDKSGALRGWVWTSLARKLNDKIEQYALTGTGMNEPLGLVNAPALVTVAEGDSTATAIGKYDVASMVARLVPGRYKGAAWICHSSVLGALYNLGELYDANADTPWGFGKIMSRPVIVSEHAKPLNTTGDLLLVAQDALFIAAKGNTAMSGEFAWDQGLSSFRSTVRCGIAPTLSAAIARTQGSTDTVSNVVCLAGSRS